MVIFLAEFKGKAKSTGNFFQRVTLAEAIEEKGALVGRVSEFFTDSEIDLTDFEFGDKVKPIWRESEFLGGRPSLVGLEKVGENPFKLGEQVKDHYAEI